MAGSGAQPQRGFGAEPPGVVIPPVLTQPGGAGSTAAGAAWLAGVPELVARAVERWQLRLEAPFGVGTASWTAPGALPDGTPVVLKISFPHDEARYEAMALALWRGSAAVELLAHDADDWALLLRRAHPGTPLLTSADPPEVQIDACLGVLANLHLAPVADVGVPVLREVCAHWAGLARQRVARWSHLLGPHAAVVARGIAALESFALDGEGPVALLHGDLNPGNVILDDPGVPHWLAIDPKPMVGDPAYELWPVLSQIDDPMAHPDPFAVAAPRLAHAASALGLPARRIASWALARTVEAALWKLDTWPTPESQADAIGWLREAQLWADLADAT